MNRVVITGVGPICAFGAGQELFSESLKESRSAILDIAMFENDQYPSHTAGTVEDFDVDDFLPTSKNYLDRNTELAFAAFHLALEDSSIELAKITSKPALILGTAYGAIDTIDRFYKDVRNKGLRFGKPILFPHTYSNTAISMISIEYGLDGPHMNFSSGWVASSHSIIYGFDLVRNGKSTIAFVGGVDAFSEPLFRFCLEKKLLVEDHGGFEECAPFNDSINGMNIGEGASFLALESLVSAEARGAEIKAEIRGATIANQPGGLATGDGAIEESMRKAINSAGLKTTDIDLIYASANGLNDIDNVELKAIENLLPRSYITTIKPLIGETFGASGAFQVAAAIHSIKTKTIPPLTTILPDTNNVKFAMNPIETEVNNVLINSIDPGGAVTTIIISKYQK